MISVEARDGVEMDGAQLALLQLEGETGGGALVVHQSAKGQGPGPGQKIRDRDRDKRSRKRMW